MAEAPDGEVDVDEEKEEGEADEEGVDLGAKGVEDRYRPESSPESRYGNIVVDAHMSELSCCTPIYFFILFCCARSFQRAFG